MWLTNSIFRLEKESMCIVFRSGHFFKQRFILKNIILFINKIAN